MRIMVIVACYKNITLHLEYFQDLYEKKNIYI